VLKAKEKRRIVLEKGRHADVLLIDLARTA
jgi:hypothetical protein